MDGCFVMGSLRLGWSRAGRERIHCGGQKLQRFPEKPETSGLSNDGSVTQRSIALFVVLEARLKML
jgi:hypothetical protein